MKESIKKFIFKIFDILFPDYIFWIVLNIIRKKITKSSISKIKFVGEYTKFDYGVVIHNPENLEIGNHSSFGDRVIIKAFGGVKIGSRVMIAHDVSIITTTHDHTSSINTNEILYDSVMICDDVWIGAKAIIMPGVKIGSNSVIGAGSIVTRSVPEGVIVYGTPAKVITTKENSTLKNNFKSFKY